MNYRDLTIKLNIALKQVPEEYVLEIVDRIQKSSVAIVGEYTSGVRAERIVEEGDKMK